MKSNWVLRTSSTVALGLIVVAAISSPMHLFGFGKPKSAAVAIPAQYEAVRTFPNDLVAAQMDGSWGILRPAGTWELEPKFEAIEEEDGRIVATLPDGTKQSLHRDKTTQALIVRSAEDEGRRCETSLGVQFIRRQGKFLGVTDEKRREVIPSRFNAIHYLGQDLYVGEEYGKGDHLIHANGRTLFHETFGHILPEISFNRIQYRNDDKSGMLDLRGQVLWPRRYWRFQFAGNLVACTEGGSLALRDNAGREISPPLYDETIAVSATTFLAVNYGTGLGTIYTNEGQILARELQVSDGVLRHGLLPVKGPDERYGYVDAYGKLKIPYSFYYAASFSAAGVALIGARNESDNYRVGLIDTTGKIILPTEYEDISFADGVYTVVKAGRWQLLDAQLKPVTRLLGGPVRYLGNHRYVTYKIRHKLSYQRASIWFHQKARLSWQGERTALGVYDFNGNLLLSPDEFDDELKEWPGTEALVAFKSKDRWGFKQSGTPPP